MRTLILAGVPLDVLDTDWRTDSRPAVLVVRLKNDRKLLVRLTAALRGRQVHSCEVDGGLKAQVEVASLITDKHRITLQLRPVEAASTAAAS